MADSLNTFSLLRKFIELITKKENKMPIQPEGEQLRKAAKWILETLKYEKGRSRAEVIQEACLKFDLTPMDAEYLANFLKDSK